MAVTNINSEDSLVQSTFIVHLEKTMAGWDKALTANQEAFQPERLSGTREQQGAAPWRSTLPNQL